MLQPSHQLLPLMRCLGPFLVSSRAGLPAIEGEAKAVARSRRVWIYLAVEALFILQDCIEKREIYILVVLALLCAPLATPYASRRPVHLVSDAPSPHWRRPAPEADTGTSCRRMTFRRRRRHLQ
jgi:hypothetical protein